MSDETPEQRMARFEERDEMITFRANALDEATRIAQSSESYDSVSVMRGILLALIAIADQ